MEEETKALAQQQQATAAMQQQQRQQQQQQQQQHHHHHLLLLQQLQRQKQQQQHDAISRFPSNIDAHLRPQHHHFLQRPQSHIPNPSPNSSTPNPNSKANPSPISKSSQHHNLMQNQSSTHHRSNFNNNNINDINVNNNNNNSSSSSNPHQQQQNLSRPNQAELQMAYQDAWRVCHPDFKRPFSSLEDACERLLPYHVVADYEAEEDDKILDSDTTGQMLSRSQQWDHNIAAKVAEFTATFEKQVLAFNIISRKRSLGEFRTEEKLMMEQFLLLEERRTLVELQAEMDSQQKLGRENHEANLRMAATLHAERTRGESVSHATEMVGRTPIRATVYGSQNNNIPIGHDVGEQGEEVNTEMMTHGWGNNNTQKDEKEASEDFLNDEETENGDIGMQSEWHGGGELDLNTR